MMKEDNERVVLILLTQAAKKKKMSQEVILNLSKIMNGNFSEVSKCNSSLALAFIVEYLTINEI